MDVRCQGRAAVEKIFRQPGGKVVDAGLYVTPGLIDIHVHIGHGGAPLDWFTPGAQQPSAIRIPADLAFQAGVTSP
jgi:imidazolonepropionase-like amidohydrolase